LESTRPIQPPGRRIIRHGQIPVTHPKEAAIIYIIAKMKPIDYTATELPPQWENAVEISTLEERSLKNGTFVFRKGDSSPFTGCAKGIFRCCQGSKESNMIFVTNGHITRWIKFGYGLDTAYEYSKPLELEFDILCTRYPLSWVEQDSEILDLDNKEIVSISTGEAASPLAPRYANHQNTKLSSLVIDPEHIYLDCKKPHKMSLAFYSNGQPSSLVKWRQDKLQEAVGWNADGSLNTTHIVDGTGFTIQSGIQCSEILSVKNLNCISSGDNMQISECHWLNGKRHGQYFSWRKQKEEDRCFDSNKHYKAEEGQYTNGKKNGLWRRWHGIIGQLCTETNYRKGKKYGEYKYWKPNGVLGSIEHYRNDKLHGHSLSFFDNGKMKQDAYYKNGVLIGRIARWDEHGNTVD